MLSDGVAQWAGLVLSVVDCYESGSCIFSFIAPNSCLHWREAAASQLISTEILAFLLDWSNRFLKTGGKIHPSPKAASNADIKKKRKKKKSYLMDWFWWSYNGFRQGRTDGCNGFLCWLPIESQLHQLSMEHSIHLLEAPYTCSWGNTY